MGSRKLARFLEAVQTRAEASRGSRLLAIFSTFGDSAKSRGLKRFEQLHEDLVVSVVVSVLVIFRYVFGGPKKLTGAAGA